MLLAEQVRAILEDSIDTGLDEDRDYLGMSQIWKCARKLYLDMVNGRRQLQDQALRRCHEGYLHQEDVLDRLDRAGVPVLEQDRELVAPFDERFRGHIDGEIDGDLLEIKSLEKFPDLVQIQKQGPRDRERFQVQAYMRYGDYDRALIVYKVRADGALWVVYMTRKDGIGDRIESKARTVLEAVDRGYPPACTCGHCRR